MSPLRFNRKSILFSLALAVALFWPPNTALAQDTGMYFSVFGGGTYVEDSTLEVVGIEFAELQFDTGWNVGGAIGHDYGNFRAELEVTYKENELDTLTTFISVPGLPAGVYPADGEVSALTYMVNVFWDFENSSPLTPYVGGGIGGASIDIDDEDDTAFAYKAAAGVAWKLGPNLDLLVDYSYLSTTDLEFNVSGATIPVEADYTTHSVSGGIRFRF